MIVCICSGGPSNELGSLERFLNRDDVYFIGADQGAATLLQKGIMPDAMVGDFDSIDTLVLKLLEKKVAYIEYADVEKDETDTDLALNHAISLKPTEIILIGVTGGRLDHEEAAKRSLLRIQLAHPEITCAIENTANRLQFLVEPNRLYPLHATYAYVSFFAYFEHIQAVTLKGVKYETVDVPMPLMSSMFTSNEIVKEEASIVFSNGICLMIQSRD
jgi:thiamine pyrophosphokinase